MTVDQGWRGFVNGTNHILLAKTLQNVTDNFLDDMWKQQFLVEDVFKRIGYQSCINTTDLSRLKPLFHMPMKFQYGGSNLLNFLNDFRKGAPDTYLKLESSNDSLFITMKRHSEFFRSARSLIEVRNVDAHNKNPINTTGWSLLVAGHVMTIVELLPTIQETKEFLPLRENLLTLLAEIVDLEKGEDLEDEELIAVSLETLPSAGVTSEYLEEKINDLSDSIKLKVSSDFNYLNQRVDELPNLLSLSIVDKIKDSLAIENLVQDKREYSSVEFNPSKDAATTEEESELAHEWRDQRFEEENKQMDLEDSVAVSFLTPSEADREMLVLQKQIKKETKCKNWENIAQGPIRTQILTNNINTLQGFLSNDVIKLKYDQHEIEMQDQIDSDLGNKFFQLLERITWD